MTNWNNYICGRDFINFLTPNLSTVRTVFLSLNTFTNCEGNEFADFLTKIDDDELKSQFVEIFNTVSGPFKFGFPENLGKTSHADFSDMKLTETLSEIQMKLCLVELRMIRTACRNFDCHLRLAIVITVDRIIPDQLPVHEPDSLVSAVSSQLEESSFFSEPMNSSIMNFSSSDEESEYVQMAKRYFEME